MLIRGLGLLLTRLTISIAKPKSSSMPWYCIDMNRVLIRIIMIIPASNTLLSTTCFTRFLNGFQNSQFRDIPAQHEQHFLTDFSVFSLWFLFVRVFLVIVLSLMSCGYCVIWKTEIDSACESVKQSSVFATWSNMALWIVSSKTTSCSPYTRLKTLLRLRREKVEPCCFCLERRLSVSWKDNTESWIYIRS